MGLKKKKKTSKKSARVGKGFKKKVSLKKIAKAAAFKSTPSKCALKVIRLALKKGRSAVKEAGGKKILKYLVFYQFHQVEHCRFSYLCLQV